MGAAMIWPGFVNLVGAWFFLALIPLIILYFLKLKRPRHEISSLVLWQSVVNDQRVNSPFQKFRRNLLLLLQLILLCLLVLALMQPFLQADAETAEYLPIVIDCSASMSATDEATGKTRLELVKEIVQEQIDNLSGDQRIALFSFSTSGRRLTEFTNDRRVLTRALARLEPTHLPGQLDDVLRMAAAYTRTFVIDKVIVLTDGNLPDTVDFELPFSLEIQRVDAGGPNVGITEMSARRSGTEEWEVFVRAAGSTVDLRGAQLQILENGNLVTDDAETVEVARDESQRIVFPVTSTGELLVEARLVPDGFDSITIDNAVWLTLPAPRPLDIWVSPELFSWEHALRVLPQLELESGPEDTPTGPEYDLIVSADEDIGGAEAAVLVFVGVIPSDLSDLISVQEDATSVVDWNRTNPLLRHVQLGDLQIGESPAYADGAGVMDLEERGYEVLIDGRAGPLLLQRREGLKVSFYFTFHTDRSTLPYRLGFPIIAANAVEAALKQASLSDVVASPTGVLPALNLEASRDYSVQGPDGDTSRISSTDAGMLAGIGAPVVGLYRILDQGEVVTSLGTGLLNPLETSLDSVEELQFTELSVSTTDQELLESNRPLWWTLAFVAFGFMLVEWWYFQRVRGVIA
jgi:Aerotolerance regulator N-terminal/von Willebrand factor type A domain